MNETLELNKKCWDDAEFLKQYRNEYYRTNLKDKYKQSVKCESCNREINLSSYKRHLETTYHKLRLLNLDEQNEVFKQKVMNS